ncbi:kinase-like protein [Rhizoclosmatium globosum]|uniref:Kinase-like protein n=1 Tax=Rhizoclosmatium globosum TaxID=329046 RepID=A0A1Y2CIJ5_9FUNG|nr:kinase-like protein [Rhizoclosmatium globosum]|eukprot:ORY46849.1 kinase-like protein [Rhizoclosmatium globosum]
MFTPSSTPEPVSTKSSKVRMIPLVSNLTSEQKARVAVIYAFALNHELFLTHFNVCGVIGHGTNGVVLGAKDLSTGQSVAIKIIYKTQVSTNEPFPSEIGVLKALNSHPLTSSTTLNFVTAWQDEHHFYLVTQFFGTNWMASVPESKLAPILFQSNSMRRYQHLTEGTTLLPLQPIKHIIRSVASALWGIHQAVGDCTHPQVLLADYGHCDRVEAGISRYGTREVSPPEFLAILDGQTADVFALGIVLYSLLSEIGSLPTVGDALQKGTIGYKYLVGADDGRYLFDEVGDVIDDEAWD